MTFIKWAAEVLVAAILRWLVPLLRKDVETARDRETIRREAEAKAQARAEELKQADTPEERERATTDLARDSF